MVAPLGGTTVIEPQEMAFGLNGNDKRTKLRNRMSFVLRSTIMSMRAVNLGSVEVTVDRLWSTFLRRLKKELVEELYVAKLEGSVTLLESHTLVAGLLGRLVDGCVEWSAELSDVTYEYYNLFN